MVTSADYDKIIQEKAQVVLDAMAERVSASDLQRIREAF